MRIVVDKSIAARRERVFAMLTDVEHWPEVISAIERVEVLAPSRSGPAVVGLRFRETRTMFGRQASEEMTVAEIIPPERFVLTAFNHGTSYRAWHVLTEADGVTHVALGFEGLARTLAARVMLPLGYLMVGHLRRQLAADLDDLARAAERADSA